MEFNTCVSKDGRFITGIHQPEFLVRNLRENDYPDSLGKLTDGTVVGNNANFPPGDVHEPSADTIYEIHNPFGFRGTTYINSAWADTLAGKPEKIGLPEFKTGSFLKSMDQWCRNRGVEPDDMDDLFCELPPPVLVAIAATSEDHRELKILAHMACTVISDDRTGKPAGISFKKNSSGKLVADIKNHDVFEALVNNPNLPDDYKQAMVLKPGVQGDNEITGEWKSEDGQSHVFEYLRRNSYIPWGHFAANMANDAVRYRARDLKPPDMIGMRHLYYQRTYVRLSQELDIRVDKFRKGLDPQGLEDLRQQILRALKKASPGRLAFNGSLWGWNFGFQMAHSGYRLHASHQQIHQQNAMIPSHVTDNYGQPMPTFACGDMVDRFIRDYRAKTGVGFFRNYLNAIYKNTRTDNDKTKESSLVVYEDDVIILFVPKAQVSQWEIQLMPKTPCGNILEADEKMRYSLDIGILTALKVLERLGAKMVTSVEFSKRFDSDNADQFLVYSFIPRLPQAPPTFSEAQFRWISGCYPEDFASACRNVLKELSHDSPRFCV